MLAYVVRRLVATVFVMAFVAFFVFSLLYLTPGDPAATIAGDLATADDIARIHRQLGLDDPFLVRFGHWAWGVLQGDLGTSIFTNLPVTTLIGQRVGPTVSLTVIALIITLSFAIPLGVIAASKVGSWIDRLVMVVAVLGFSVPSFVLAYIAILCFSVWLGWLPVQGYASLSEGFAPFIEHLILPSIVLGLIYGALIARITRAAMLEVLSQDYIRTAQAKGLTEGKVLVGHALRNAAIPIVTVIGLQLGLLLSGAVLTETIFSLPGVGRLMVDSILSRDYPVVQAGALFIATLFVLVNLVVDLSYAILDPRISRP